jgi:amino acid adenylation domain-containing protein
MTRIEKPMLAPETGAIGGARAANSQRAPLFVGLNRTRVESPRNQCIHQLIEEQVRRTPNETAVIFENERLNYRELNGRANQVAHRLKKLGVGPDVLVGVFMERSAHLVIGLLAVLKAGGAYVPIDPVYPQERIAFMLEDAEVKVLLTEPKLEPLLPRHPAKVLLLDTEARGFESERDTNPPPSGDPGDLAYVMFTSGSTGRPKGVLVTHHNVVRLMQATEAWFHFEAIDVWTLFHSHAFDLSVWELCGALFYGAKLVVVPYLTSRSPEDFYGLLVREGVTVLTQTPSAFKQLMCAEERLGTSPKLALRYVIFAGEALAMRSLKPWFERHDDHRPQLVNMYGITETTVHVTYRPLSITDLDSGSVVGVPIPDLQVHILDASQQPVLAGAIGELYVGGAGVARGYLNRPELTREKFLPDPFANDPEARLYRSGDLARFLPNGEIEYLGRCDNQLKIRGFRIEPGEIETVLCQHSAVREALVVAHPHGEDEQLVAYLISRPGAQPSRGELRAFIQPRLPDYMVPAHYVWLDEMPLTPHGKLDRRALPEPDFTELQASDGHCGARNDLERTLANVWQAVLGVPRVGTADSFFELGGTSLMMVQVHQRLASVLPQKVRTTALFQYPTIAGLAQHLSQAADMEKTQAKAAQDRAMLQREALSRQRAPRAIAQSSLIRRKAVTHVADKP